MCAGEKEKQMVILLSVKEVLKLTGLKSRPGVWRLVKDGKFPAPLRLPGDVKHRYFRQDEVIAWKAERAAWRAECAKRSRIRARGRVGMGTGPDGDADARKAGNRDFEKWLAKDKAASKISEVQAEERIRKGLEAAKPEVRL